MSEQAGNSELLNRWFSRIQGLEGSNSLWQYLRQSPRLVDATVPPDESVPYAHNRLIAEAPPGGSFGPMVVHFADYPHILPGRHQDDRPALPSDVYFAVTHPGRTVESAAGLTIGETYNVPSVLSVHYSDREGRMEYGKPTDEILIAGPDNGDFVVITPREQYILRPTPRSRHSARRKLTGNEVLTGYYSGSPAWASRFEVGPESVGFMLHQGSEQIPFVIPRTITVAKP